MCRAFLRHQDRKRQIPIVFDECPERCEKERKDKWNFERFEFCDGCRQQLENKQFRRETDAIFEERFKDELTTFEFNRLLNTVHRIIGLEETPKDEYSAKTQILLRSFQSEKYKFERYQDSKKTT